MMKPQTNSAGMVFVRFLRHWNGCAEDEVHAFPEAKAKALVDSDQGWAEYCADPRKAKKNTRNTTTADTAAD